MKAEHLTNWQPEATTEQLNEFIQQNSTLLTLLEEAWAKFAATLPEKTPVSQSNYGENVDWDTLEHFPISHEEMSEFLNHFEKERHHTAHSATISTLMNTIGQFNPMMIQTKMNHKNRSIIKN